MKIKDFDINQHKTPYLYEIWNWEGDESILPHKWLSLIGYSEINKNQQDQQLIKKYIKSNYYSNEKFDRKSFFFITNRSDNAGCCYLNKNDNSEYTIEFLLVNNKKHINKGIEEALINLCVKRLIELDALQENIFLDLATTNVDTKILENLKFINIK